MNPLVSVIIPCFNAEKYIFQAIESVLKQTYRNFELIIVNDGSTDNSEKVILEFQRNDSRIKYVYQANCGVSIARNRGMEQAAGDCFAFLDADDTWKPENIAAKIKVLFSGKDIHWVFSDIYLADENLKIFQILEAGSDNNILESLLIRSGDVIHAPSNIIVKKEGLFEAKIKFDPRLSTSADWDFCIQLAAHNFIGKRVSKPLWTYRIMNNSMSRNIEILENDNLLVFRKWNRKKIFHSFLFESKCRSNLLLALGGCWWVNGRNKPRGVYFVLRAILAYPPNILKLLSKLIPYYLISPDITGSAEKQTIPVFSSVAKKPIPRLSSQINNDNIHIFLFHRVNPEYDPIWNPMKPELFEKIILFLKNKYHVILLEEHLINPVKGNKKPFCAITFDDGYKDYIEYGLPILSKHGCPASMYLVTDCINQNLPPWTYILNHAFIHTSRLGLDINTDSFPKKLKTTRWKNKEARITFARNLSLHFKSITHDERINLYNEIICQFNDVEFPTGLMMTWEEVKETQQNNTGIGSHTVTHPLLSKKLFSEEELRFEIQGSSDIIREKTGITPVSIAYPFGSYNNAARQMAKLAGYKFALTTVPYPYDMSKYDLFQIPRIELFNEPFFKSKLRMNGIIQTINTLRNH